jgi:hypothetical protein
VVLLWGARKLFRFFLKLHSRLAVSCRVGFREYINAAFNPVIPVDEKVFSEMKAVIPRFIAGEKRL